MSSPSHVADTPITHRDQLVAVLASGEKPKQDWRIGTEHEKFGFRLDDLRPPTLDGDRGVARAASAHGRGPGRDGTLKEWRSNNVRRASGL